MICVDVICVVCICMWYVVCMAAPVYAQYFAHPLGYMRSMMPWSVYKGFSHPSHWVNGDACPVGLWKEGCWHSRAIEREFPE